MASYHHCHPNPAASCCRSHTCCCHPPPPPPPHHHHHLPPPPPPQQQQQQNDLHSFYQNSSPQVDLYHHLELEAQSYPHPPIHHSQQQFFKLRRNPTQEETYPSLSSLIRRIDALESSLLRHRLSSTSASAWSLRDFAARTIQIHFRSFLARRSRTLSQLKELASIKSALHSLKTSTSGNAQFDPLSISRKTTALLQKLESIQGGDPMIRDGKRSINRELIRFRDFIDRVFSRVVRSTQHRVNISRVFSPVDVRDLSKNEKESRGRSIGLADKIRSMIEDEEGGFDIGDLPAKTGSSHSRSGGLLKKASGGGGGEGKVKKTVTFADNGKLYRATIATPERNSSGEEEEDYENEPVESLGRKVEETGGREDEDEDEDETEAEEDEDEDEDGYKDDFVFSPPLPVKMDGRADLIKKTKR